MWGYVRKLGGKFKMKKFQRIAALCLLAVLCLCLCACGSAKVQLKILDTEYALEDYAICIAKDREDLLNDVNTALNAQRYVSPKKWTVTPLRLSTLTPFTSPRWKRLLSPIPLRK